MREAGVLIEFYSNIPLYWHAPAGRSSVYIPDSRSLWDAIWEHRYKCLGFAHTHPGSGTPTPSHEDLTTFRAIEQAIGRQVGWLIASSDVLVQVDYIVDLSYELKPVAQLPSWFDELQRLSHSKED